MFFIRGRIAWGARRPKSTPTRDNWSNGVDVVLHHTADAGPASLKLRDKRRYLQGIQTFHQQVRGWSDIGYNYLIFPDGSVFEGRGFGVRGAHVLGRNTDSCGISIVGNFTKAEPTPQAQAAYHRLIKRLEAKGARVRSVKGHGDLMATSCPGKGVRKTLLGRNR